MNLRSLFSNANSSKPDRQARLSAVGSAFSEAIDDARRELEGLSRRYEQGIDRACLMMDADNLGDIPPDRDTSRLRIVEQNVMRVRARMLELKQEIARLAELEREFKDTVAAQWRS